MVPKIDHVGGGLEAIDEQWIVKLSFILLLAKVDEGEPRRGRVHWRLASRAAWHRIFCRMFLAGPRMLHRQSDLDHG